MRSNDVTLFSNGIGHFRRYYEVDKNLEISIPFKKGHVGDVASSLQVFGNVKLHAPLPSRQLIQANLYFRLMNQVL